MFDQLKRWLRGDADWKAEQQLDQSAQKDAFLGDALDGYRTFPESDHANTIEELKARLADKSKKKRGAVLWMRYAAAASVIGLVGLFFWLSQNPDNPSALALEEKQINMASDVDPEKDEVETFTEKESIGEEKNTFPNDNIASDSEGSNKDLAASLPKADPPRLKVDPSNIEAGIMEDADAIVDIIEPAEPEIFTETPVPAASDELLPPAARNEEEVTTAPIIESYAIEDSAPVQTAREADKKIAAMETELASRSRKESDKNMGRAKAESSNTLTNAFSSEQKVVTGRITEALTGEALIGANVLIKGTKDGVTTDFDGRFRLSSNQNLPWILVISYIGFNEEEIEVNDISDPILIELNDNGLVLSEVVVTGLSSNRKDKSAGGTASKPRPTSSFSKLRKHLKKNLQYPDAARQNKVEGKVRLRFYIDVEGNPTQFTILKSLGYGMDEEAIRLMETGPKWKPPGTWATYEVKFKL